MLETEFGVENAADVRMIIKIDAGVNEDGKPRIPDPPPEDPICVRKP
ncbi:hypothetical protein ACVIRO_002881 [Rhizobium ruizarguesonis]